MYTALMSDTTISVAPVRRKAAARGLTSIRQFAAATGLHYAAARRWWNDDVSQIHADTLAQLAEFFDCDPGDLLETVEREA